MCLSYLGIHGALEPCGTLTQHLYGRNALCLQPREAHEVSFAALCWADVERLTEGRRILGRQGLDQRPGVKTSFFILTLLKTNKAAHTFPALVQSTAGQQSFQVLKYSVLLSS